MKEWHDLFVATTGAAAALVGLIFVGVSINLSRILSISKLPNRAFVALLLLLVILVLSIVLLIPQPSLFADGIEVLLIWFACWIVVTKMDISIYRETGMKFKTLYLSQLLINQIGLFPFLISGVLLLNGMQIGIYWIVVGFIICLIKAFLDAWVLLVEINR